MKTSARWVLSALCLVAGAMSAYSSEDRIVQKVDKTRTATLRGFVHPKTRVQADLGLVAASQQIPQALLLLQPTGDVDALLRDQQTPGSPNFHKWLQPEQFAERFGASQNDVAKVVQWLQDEGLHVDSVARGRQFVTFSGAAGAISEAFQTEFREFDDHGRVRFANTKDISVPAALARVVAGVRGFNNFGLKPFHRQARLQPNFNSASGTHYLSPGDIATIFNFKPLYASGIDGKGQSVAVVGQTNIDLADIRAFRKTYGLPANDPEIQLFGPNPGLSLDDQYEADLDLEWAGAAAPNARIVYVNSTDVILSTYYAVDNNIAPVISMSYGGCEVENTPDIRFLGQQANAQGITWVVASGDSGAAGCDFSTPGPQATKGRVAQFPASLPEVTAIGGTTLNEGSGKFWATVNNPTDASSALSYIPEVAWNDTALRNELAATGGGASIFYPKPWWQVGKGVPDDGARDVPDVSFPASPDHDGYLVQSGGAQYVFGGTSVGTPIFAGVLALVNQSLVTGGKLVEPGLGNVNSALYRLAQASTSVYHDTMSGDNIVPCSQGSPDCVDGKLGYAAGPGYDLTTGLGSPDVTALVKLWNLGISSTLTLLASPSSASLNDNITLTATVKSSGTSRPTGTVTFLSSYNQLGTVSLTPGPGTTAIATLGVPMVRIAEGTGSVSAIYAGDGVVEGSGGSSFVDLIIPATGSLVIPSVDPNPVYQFGSSYVFTVTLQEAAGVSTRVTGFAFDGASVALSVLGRTTLSPFGFIQATLTSASGINPAAGSHVFTFTGADNNGRTWTQSVTAVFLPSNNPALTPSILLTSVPRAVNRNQNADPNCQWAQQFTVQEQGGFLTNLTGFSVGNSSQPNLIQQIFGTTRLAPWGVLYGTQCYNSNTVASNRTFTLTGVGEIGSVSSVTTASYSPAPVAPAGMSLSRPSLVFTMPEAGPARTSPVDITITGGEAVWTLSKLPDNQSTKWLSLANTSGEGPGRFTVQVSSAGLSRGVYRAFVTVQASNAFPQAINVPVTLVVGASPALAIAGVSNAASFGPTGAPGAQMRVFGLNLAPSSSQATRFPLPISLGGVSVTVNGVSAPIYAVAPDRIDVQIPYETALGTAVLAVNNNGQIAWQEFVIATAAPGIFSGSNRLLTPASTASPGQTITAYMTGDGDVSPTLTTGDTPPQGTSLGRLPRPRLPVTVTVGGVQASVKFVGITPGTAGVTQLNFTLADSTPPGTQPVIVSVGGVNSPPVNLTVQ